MKQNVQELINICDNLMIEYDMEETGIQIVIGNQEISVDKKTGRTDNFYYPTVKSIIESIESW